MRDPARNSVQSLAEAVDVKRGDLISLVGGGGKTTLMYRLARELRDAGLFVAAATTTKIEPPRERGFALLAGSASCEELQACLAKRADEIPVLGERVLPSEKVGGIPPEWCDRLVADGAVDALVVEADGAARKPVKAPAAWEPVVPRGTTIFVAVLGLSCIGRPLGPESVFRPDRVAEVTGFSQGSPLTVEVLCRLAGAPDGLLKGRPGGARAVAILNQKDVSGATEPASVLARCLLSRSGAYERVVVAALRRLDLPLEVWRV